MLYFICNQLEQKQIHLKIELSEEQIRLQQVYIDSLRDDIIIHDDRFRILETCANLMVEVNVSPRFTLDSEISQEFIPELFSHMVNFEQIQNDLVQQEQYNESLRIMREYFDEVDFDDVADFSNIEIQNVIQILEDNEFQFAPTINILYNRIMTIYNMNDLDVVREYFHFKWLFARYLSKMFMKVFRKYVQYHIEIIQNRERFGEIENCRLIVQSVKQTIMSADFHNIWIIYPIHGLYSYGNEVHFSRLINIFFDMDFYNFVKDNLIGNSAFFPDLYQQLIISFNTKLLYDTIYYNNIEQFEFLVDEIEIGHNNNNQKQIYVDTILFEIIMKYCLDYEEPQYEIIFRLVRKIIDNLNQNQRIGFRDLILQPLMEQMYVYVEFEQVFNNFIDWIQNDYDLDGIILPQLHRNIFNRDEFLHTLRGLHENN